MYVIADDDSLARVPDKYSNAPIVVNVVSLNLLVLIQFP